jgi:hypothetical protein
MGTAGDDFLRGTLDNSTAALVSRATDAPLPGGGNGGYEFDEETLRAKIGEWHQLAEDIAFDGRRLDDAWKAIQPPSDDQPAREQVEATVKSISAAIVHNKAMQGYVKEYIEGLEKALKDYLSRERAVTDTLNSGVPQS